MDETVKRLLEGDQRALSRLISLIERGDPRGAEVMAEVHPHTGRAYCIGVTGPPGVGKSTLVDRLAEQTRSRGLSVGIIAVDPTSPYSGGAFLGDRIRMQRHYLDAGIFIRSMATREGPGGLPRIVRGVVRLLDASGKDVVIVETVGVGQTELGVMGVADTVVVTLMPEAGDIIQTLKAGLMEIADIYVVNKADREGANQMMVAITSMLKMATAHGDWIPPVLATQANKNEGVPELYGDIQHHRDFLEQDSRLEQRRGARRGEEFLVTIEEELGRRLKELMAKDMTLGNVLEEVKKGEREPYSSALKLLEDNLTILKDLASSPARQ
jgi:LAO/AO transport system kinase